MGLVERARGADPAWLVELFAASNLGFLAVDIYLAHLSNGFRASAEWIPVVFSVVAPLLLAPGLFGGRWRRGAGRAVGYGVGAASIAVGVLGLVYHLQSAFFELFTLKSLVYTAPFAAPLAYAGVGLLLVLDRMLEVRSREWAAWVLLLALGGFAGNLALSLADHAQNGFFSALEWLPVIAAAYGFAFLAVAVGSRSRAYLTACIWIAALEIGVGVLGFLLHARADWLGAAQPLRDRLLYGAPIFAPLLFADLALLAVIGLRQRRVDVASA